MATEYFNDAWRIPNNKNQSLVSNYSMEFDKATGENIDLGNENYLKLGAEDFTWSGWINPSSWGTSFDAIYVCAATNGVWIGSFGTNFVLRKVNVSNILSYPLPAINTWTHICITRNNGTCVLYFNGISVDSATSTHDFTVSANVYLGAYGAAASLGFSGKIDQVSIFDYALPATGTNSVATLYGGGTAVTNPMSLSPKPIAYYQLGDQSAYNGANYLVPNNSLQDYVFNFDETDDYIDLSVVSSSSVPSEESSWTYSAWIYLDSTHTQSFPTIFQRGQGYPGSGMLVRESAGNIQVFAGTALSNFTVNKLPTNAWSHFALVYDLSTNQLTCYINNLSQTLTMVAGWSILTTTFNIGFRDNNTGYWKGEMSNVQVFNTALSSTGSNSIETIYNNGSPLTSMSGFTSLQSWYKLNAQDTFDGTNWTIKDYAGSNNGTSSGMTSANLVQSNLQHTSGYSPYALSLDGTSNFLTLNNASNPQINPTLLGGTTSFTVSAWIKPSTNTYNSILGNYAGGQSTRSFWFFIYNVSNARRLFFRLRDTNANQIQASTSNDVITFDSWQHVSVTYDELNLKIFVNGVEKADTPSSEITINTSIYADTIGSDDQIGGNFFNGEISNVAVWRNSVINPVTLYNNGVPANLNNLSTKPSYWWQMGSNSSFNASTGKWTCLNEGTEGTISMPLNATTSATNSMTNDDITNGVGYSANGLGTSSIEIVGDAPYSTANGISENMDVLDRTTDVPS